MVIAIVSVRFGKIISILSKHENYHFVKRKGPQLFYYIDGDTTNIIKNTKKIIVDVLGPMTVFEVYKLYNGMIDFTAYLSDETKNESKYYNQTNKDLSDEELENWKKENLK